MRQPPYQADAGSRPTNRSASALSSRAIGVHVRARGPDWADRLVHVPLTRVE